MLTALDHIVLLTRDFDRAVTDYQILFGFKPEATKSGDTYRSALFQTGNCGLEIMSPVSATAKNRTDDILGEAPARLTSLAFTSDDITEAHRLLTRRGANPGDLGDNSFRLSDNVCAGLKTFIVKSQVVQADRALRLDHTVINTPNPDRAIAHYGARLGIRFALDRTEEKWGARFLFFKLGDIVLEVIHRLGKSYEPSDNDKLWGLTWKVEDLAATHERLTEGGVTVSEIRTGRKPGTQVFTAKSHSQHIPTLFLAQSGKP